jgi:hypothetical protein
MATETRPHWWLKGTVLVSCNCDYGCPCNFNALPTKGNCEGGWMWHVGDGRFDDVSLADLNFGLYVKWPGAIHHGNGEGVFFIDERADERQQGAIASLVKGAFGGPWGVLAWTWPTLHGPKRIRFDLQLDGIRTRIKAGTSLIVESTTIRNPVTGAEVHPGVVLPEGLIVKNADLGCSSTFRVTDAITLDHSGQYTAVGPFEYAGP